MNRMNRALAPGVAIAVAACLTSCALIYDYGDLSYTSGSSGSSSTSTCGDGGGSVGLGTARWSKGFGAVPSDGGASVANATLLGMAVDPDGNTIFLGTFEGTLQIGSQAFASAASEVGLYLAKLDPAGKVLWAHHIGDGPVVDGIAPFAGRVAADPEGNIVLGLTFRGKLSPDATHAYTNTGYGDVFLAKLDPKGTVRWGHHTADLNSQLAYDVAVSETGTIALTGFYNQALAFNGCPSLPGPPGGPGNGFNMFVATFDGDGQCQWAKEFADADHLEQQLGLRVAIGAGGTVVAAGKFKESIDFDTLNLLTAPVPDTYHYFVVALDETSGDVRFATLLGQGEGLVSVAVNGAGEVVAAAGVQGGLIPDPTLLPGGLHDVGLLKLDKSGALVWARLFGGPSDDHPGAVTFDRSGNVLVAGSFQGSMTFGSDTLDSQGDADAFFVKLDEKGNPYASGRFGGAFNQGVAAIQSLPCGDTVLAGGYAGTIDFGDGPLPAQDTGGVFVTSFTPSEPASD